MKKIFFAIFAFFFVVNIATASKRRDARKARIADYEKKIWEIEHSNLSKKEKRAQKNKLLLEEIRAESYMVPRSKKNKKKDDAPQEEENASKLPEELDEMQQDVAFIVRKGGKNKSISRDLVKLVTASRSGSVKIFIKKNDKWLSAIQTHDMARSTYISLFIDGKEFRLNRLPNAEFEFLVEPSSICVTYTVMNLAKVCARYILFSTHKQNEECNSVIIAYTIENIDEIPHEFALKSVFNTKLGERRTSHFSTTQKNAISSEFFFEPSAQNNWIISSDGTYAVEFELYGKNITSPAFVLLANKDVAEKTRHDEKFSGKHHSASFLSYKNSAAAFFWQKREFEKAEKATYIYRMNFSASDFQNAGFEKNEMPSVILTEKEFLTFTDDANYDEIYIPPALNFFTEKNAKRMGKRDRRKKNEESTNDFSPNVSKMSPEYVQRLIDHINSLEASDPDLNRERIQAFQQEINDILEVLRSRQ